MTEKLFPTEASLVAKFCELIDPTRWRNPSSAPKWTPYHETAGWDLLLVHDSGLQIGIEAKLTLNAKVLAQALPGHHSLQNGPDFRAVLVPGSGLQRHLSTIAHHLGIVVIAMTATKGWGRDDAYRFDLHPDLPDPKSRYSMDRWPCWLPAERCKLPDYIPDVVGGQPSPVQLSEWKIKAIKLLVLLERTGAVTRRDIKALDMSPSRWTDRYHGFLSASPAGYVRNGRTPDLKAQHPSVWPQIEAEFDTWAATIRPDLIGSAA